MRAWRAVVALAVVAGAGAGCTSVKMVQRDGCWIERTERWPKRVKERIGPCARTAATWSDDRLVRLVQECVAGADYRWQSRALAAWARDAPWPDRPSEESVLAECMTEASRTAVTDNETLRQRLADVSRDRDALRTRSAAEQERLLGAQDRLAAYLGEAAKKASPPAHATAYAASDGRAETKDAGAPAAPLAVIAGGPAAVCPVPALPDPATAVPDRPTAVPEPATPVAATAPAADAPRKARSPRARAPRPAPAPATPACESCAPPEASATPGPGNAGVTPAVAPATREPSVAR